MQVFTVSRVHHLRRASFAPSIAAMASRTSGVLILLFSLVCLGTWPALLDLSTLRGRHEAHSYLDYATTVLIVATIAALSAGELAELAQSSTISAALAGGGGLLLMLGNLSMQRSLIMGVPLSIVLPLQGSLTVVLGTTVNYFLQPEANDPHILFVGVAAFLLAIFLSATAHLTHERERRGTRLRRQRLAARAASTATTQGSSSCCATWQPLLEEGATGRGHVEQSSVEAPSAASATAATATAAAGLVVAFGGGVCFGGFSPLFNLAVNDELGWIHNDPHGGKPLTVFNANLCFCAAFALSAWLVNLSLMRWPPRGRSASSLHAYLTEGCRIRAFACAAGATCAVGNACQFIGGAWAGFATADLVQAFPLVGTLWGVLLFGEFKSASRRVAGLLISMLTLYLAAVVLLCLSVR